ncbi:LysM peptidoglycan-binding domain-containing protein [Cytobacillus sp. IB215665]|uniref:LysM peptidoglycan-binding domain-containing protein n=1 Tax=Cytobacillus sp. IB215665 TaxID=3097357 RepID=UPI002A11425F|nr:LysM peptidoglycan-binding domain-containing protein [Cytobacillus sp. IB215665]MDX8364816.1 LysM peptidoglycan-binding domain-containing protein [Cytobacillus sp. IB215665]
MSNKNEKLHDQAEQLRDRIANAEDESVKKSVLPPRSHVHKAKKKKTKFRVKYPIIRLLALFFILLPIVILSIAYRNANNTLDTNSKGPVKVNIQSPNRGNVEDEESYQQSELIESESDEEDTTTNHASSDTNIENGVEQDTEITDSNSYIIHYVKNDETLFSISMKYFNSQSGIEVIKLANNIQGNSIFTGQKLLIPTRQNESK